MSNACSHDGFRGIRSAYDQGSGVLVFFWTCERCGSRLSEAHRENYRPAFDPHGNARLLSASAR